MTIHPYIYAGMTKDFKEIGERVKSDKELLDMIIQATCKELSLDKEEVLSKCRERRLVYARHIIRSIACKEIQCTLMWLGRTMKCDHASIIHSKRVVNDLIFSDKEFEKMYDNCIFRFKIIRATS